MENSRAAPSYFQRNSWKLHLLKTPLLSIKALWYLRKNQKKWKKHSVSIVVLATFFGRNLSSSDFSFSQVTSVEKREPQKHFSALACGLSLKKLFFGSLFSTSVTWEKLKSDKDKFFLRVASTIIETKYYFFCFEIESRKSFLYKAVI